MTYVIEMTKAAEKDLAALDESARSRVISTIRALAGNPRPQGAIKMEGFKNAYRVRVGSYRIGYQIHDSRILVIVTTIGDRKEIYPLMKRRLRK